MEHNKKIYIFISCDLVNSSKLKNSSKLNKEWINIVIKFFSVVFDKMKSITTTTNKITTFKYIGDEVVFYFEPKTQDEIINLPKKLYDIQQEINSNLNEYNATNIRTGVKITLWIAPVLTLHSEEIKNIDDIDDEINKDNVYKNFHIISTSYNDIIGMDMDIGFRISKSSHKNLLNISLQYVGLLMKLDEYMCKCKKSEYHIVSFENLKGIWDDRYYPIIWYAPENKWEEQINLFGYDEFKRNKIVANILEEDIMVSKNINNLNNILEELEQETNIKTIIDYMHSTFKKLPENIDKLNIMNKSI